MWWPLRLCPSTIYPCVVCLSAPGAGLGGTCLWDSLCPARGKYSAASGAQTMSRVLPEPGSVGACLHGLVSWRCRPHPHPPLTVDSPCMPGPQSHLATTAGLTSALAESQSRVLGPARLGDVGQGPGALPLAGRMPSCLEPGWWSPPGGPPGGGESLGGVGGPVLW